ncbi:hypothetical protein SAMN04487948_11720 [Halogranum amylolyticum]|uniref:DUF8129 domain-containing protein n=1 Tax=Halogranum amylolyticum TaxID=660520 RepID=A0A1H8VK72_9EURY|nr:hypothetical protein [Halogranum amylolyticum]SEP15308.1 hypothetical protein SAMN04487948_11720 [Halogranum amylolyticum]
MSNEATESTESTGLTPEQRLEAPTTHLVDAGIATIHDMATLRACVVYENVNQQRVRILRRLEKRAEEIRTQKE